MGWTETFTCNVCGKRKSESDHWWLVWIEPVQPSDHESVKPKLQILPWSELMARSPEVMHFCGAGCLLKEVERWAMATTEQSRAPARHGAK